MNIIDATLKNFKVFSKYVKPDLQFSKHHTQIADKLQDCFDGKSKRTIIVVPPQRGKSLFSSVLFPAFVLANDPNKRIIVASYSQNLSFKFTRECRDLISSERYQNLVPHAKFKKDLNKSDFFSFENSTGYYKATSITGSLTGMSADIIIVDDPFSSYVESSSPKVREDVLSWFNSVAMTRLSPGGIMIVVNTRWNVDDLVGTLLKSNKDYDVLHVKAIEDDGTICWSERYTKEDYEQIREEIGYQIFEALYQGNPTLLDNVHIATENFQLIDIDEMPNLNWIRSWDIAVSTKNVNDYTACALMAVDKYGNVFIKNVQRMKLPYNELIDKIEEVAWNDGLETTVLIENIGVGLVTFQEVQRRLQGFVVRPTENKKANKVQKAMPFVSKVEAGKVYLSKNSNWVELLKGECQGFPFAQHDDMVDAVSNGTNYCLKRQYTIEEEEIVEPGTWAYYEALSASQRNPSPLLRRTKKRYI